MIRFKSGQMRKEFYSMSLEREVRMLVMAMVGYVAGRFGRDVEVTGVFPEEGIGRITRTHVEGRAVDVGVRHWPEGAAVEVADWMNENFKTGATFKNGEPMEVAIQHDAGYGDHIHIQKAVMPITIMERNE